MNRVRPTGAAEIGASNLCEAVARTGGVSLVGEVVGGGLWGILHWNTHGVSPVSLEVVGDVVAVTGLAVADSLGHDVLGG